MEKFWPTCLSRFEQELSAQQFNTWIKPLQTELGDNVLRILAPNKFVLQWVKDRFLSKIETIATEFLPPNILIELSIFEKVISEKQNFLVIGGTGSGKTTVLQSLMTLIAETERVVIIEDTQELTPTNAATTSLLTHTNTMDPRLNVSMDDLLKRTLRLRPDRIGVGEIRGSEAKTLMMALSTGHDGSFGSMHARTAHEALLRLEMLVQMGAPEWSLHSIRRLIGITLNTILVVERRGSQRCLEGIYEIASVEENGLTLHKCC